MENRDEGQAPVPADVGRSQCDCCGRMVPREEISFTVAFGIDTYACDDCRGWNR